MSLDDHNNEYCLIKNKSSCNLYLGSLNRLRKKSVDNSLTELSNDKNKSNQNHLNHLRKVSSESSLRDEINNNSKNKNKSSLYAITKNNYNSIPNLISLKNNNKKNISKMLIVRNGKKLARLPNIYKRPLFAEDKKIIPKNKSFSGIKLTKGEGVSNENNLSHNKNILNRNKNNIVKRYKTFNRLMAEEKRKQSNFSNLKSKMFDKDGNELFKPKINQYDGSKCFNRMVIIKCQQTFEENLSNSIMNCQNTLKKIDETDDYYQGIKRKFGLLYQISINNSK